MAVRDLIPWRSRNRSLLPRRYESPLEAFHRAFDRLFEDFFGDRDWWPLAPVAEGTFAPRVDVREKDKEVVVTAELPGLEEEDVEVELSDEGLTIRGEKKQEQEERGEAYYRAERTYGAFQRFIDLPCEVDGEKAEAEFRNGILTVTLPKRPEEQRNCKTIQIKRG